MNNNLPQAQSVEEVFALFDRHGGVYYGEDINQNQHAVQCAELARREGARPELIVATLLHDVGHLLHLDVGLVHDQGVDDDHEATGAKYLAKVFPPQVTRAIALHVTAKRYRCAVEPGYFDTLSEASVLSLAVQGGPLTGEAVERFERHPGSQDALALRDWDDRGKSVELSNEQPRDYFELALSVAI
jgi:[1-hydroxy-2-(trimethylamino)ethyl]phosphonate dioxygenase